MSELLAELEGPEDAGADAEDTKRSKQAKALGELKMVTGKIGIVLSLRRLFNV